MKLMFNKTTMIPSCIRQCVVCALFVILGFEAYGQSDTLLFSYYYGKDINYFSKVDSISFFSKKHSSVKNGYYVFLNDSAIFKNSTSHSPFIYWNGGVYFETYNLKNEKSGVVEYSNRSFRDICPLKQGEYAHMGIDSMFIVRQDSVFLAPFSKCENKISVDVIDLDYDEYELVKILPILGGGYQLTFGIMEQGYTDNKFFIFNKGKILELDANDRFGSPTFNLSVLFYDEGKGIYYAKTDRYLEKSPWSIRNDIIFDENFELVTNVLKKEPLQSYNIVGYNYYDNELQSCNVRSQDDQGNEIIVPYRFNLEQEIAIRNIFRDSLLSKSSLDGFGYYELQCLYNSIYAKHNYEFSSKFFQAYFNLFNFYTLKEGGVRRKSVDHLLSENDKRNIRLINKSLKKFEKTYKDYTIK